MVLLLTQPCSPPPHCYHQHTHTHSSLPLSIPQPCAHTVTIITLREGFRIIPQKAVNRYSTYISGIVKVWYTTRQISTFVVYNDDLIVIITLREGFRIIPQKAVN